MDSFDFLIPILMFCVPLLAAIVDARKKALKKLQAEAEDTEASQQEAAAAAEPVRKRAHKAAKAQVAEEGVHSIEKKPVMAATEEKKEKVLAKESIDKKKLILYSEIMKPKFDE